MDRTERYIAAELLFSQAVAGQHLAHELYRVAHVHRAGLTEKERKFLLTRHKAMQDELNKLSALRTRLKKHP